MRVLINEATKIQVDWMVAKIEGGHELGSGPRMLALYDRFDGSGVPSGVFSPTTNPAHGTPIIEREQISVSSPEQNRSFLWIADKLAFSGYSGGADRSLLLAAMRCYTIYKLQDPHMEIPEYVAEYVK